MIRPLLTALSYALLASCSTLRPPEPPVATSIVVDVGAARITALDARGRTLLDCECETSKVGTGRHKHSKRTPLGEFHIAAMEPRHRFGPAMRLDGYQGFERGILFHRNLDGLPNGTRGCICPIEDVHYADLYRITRVGTKVLIRP